MGSKDDSVVGHREGQRAAAQERASASTDIGGRETVSLETARGIIEGSPEAPQKAAEKILDHYGPPNEGTPTKLFWYRTGPWGRIEHARPDVREGHGRLRRRQHDGVAEGSEYAVHRVDEMRVPGRSRCCLCASALADSAREALAWPAEEPTLPGRCDQSHLSTRLGQSGATCSPNPHSDVMGNRRRRQPPEQGAVGRRHAPSRGNAVADGQLKRRRPKNDQMRLVAAPVCPKVTTPRMIFSAMYPARLPGRAARGLPVRHSTLVARRCLRRDGAAPRMRMVS